MERWLMTQSIREEIREVDVDFSHPSTTEQQTPSECTADLHMCKVQNAISRELWQRTLLSRPGLKCIDLYLCIIREWHMYSPFPSRVYHTEIPREMYDSAIQYRLLQQNIEILRTAVNIGLEKNMIQSVFEQFHFLYQHSDTGQLSSNILNHTFFFNIFIVIFF